MLKTPRFIITGTLVVGTAILLLVTGVLSLSTPIENLPPDSPSQIDAVIQIDRTATASISTAIGLSLTEDSRFGAFAMLMPSSLLGISAHATPSWITPLTPFSLNRSTYELRYDDRLVSGLKPLSAIVPEGLFITLPWDQEAPMPAGNYIFTLQTDVKGLVSPRY